MEIDKEWDAERTRLERLVGRTFMRPILLLLLNRRRERIMNIDPRGVLEG